jgi:hypothetical protein
MQVVRLRGDIHICENNGQCRTCRRRAIKIYTILTGLLRAGVRPQAISHITSGGNIPF